MMKHGLRALALLLCVLLLSGCTWPEVVPWAREEEAAEESSTQSGSFGIYMTWTLSDEHTLHISGRGVIPDYWGDTTKTPNWPAWHEFRDTVTTLVVEEGVSVIGSRAFTGFSKLTNVMLPENLLEIGASAFENCESLAEIVSPDSVHSIGKQCFAGCGLKSVAISPFVEQIGDKAFDRCEQLLEILVDPDNPAYASKDGVFFTKDLTRLLCLPGGKTGAYALPDSVILVAEGVFAGCELSEIRISGNFKVVSSGMFADCEQLTELWLEEGVTTIEDRGLTNCPLLRAVHIPASLSIINGNAFDRCPALQEISVTEGNLKFASEDGVLYSLDKKRLVRCPAAREGAFAVPGGVESIDPMAFEACVGLSGIEFPLSLTEIGDGAFEGCTGLSGLDFGLRLERIGAEAFRGCTQLRSLTIPNSVRELGESAFFGCAALESLSLGSGLEAVAACAFEGCGALRELNFSHGAGSVDRRAFYGCVALESVVPSVRVRFL